MNVLVLHSELGVLWGGGETFTTNLFAAFAKRGHRVTAAFVADPNGRYPRALPASFERLPIPGRWSRKPGQATLSAIGTRLPARFRPGWGRLQEAICWRSIRWHNRRFERRIAATLSDRWPDYHAVYVNGNVGLARRAASCLPTLLMLPGPVTQELAPVLRRIHAVCAHDDALETIRGFLGAGALELPLGLDSELFQPGSTMVRADLGWSDVDIVVGYVGRLALIKGVDLLAAAFAELSREVPNAKLLVVGSGEEESRLRSVLAGPLAEGRVHLQPAVAQSDLPRWYCAMDLFVMPSRYETMSNAALEAMACGVPFLASAVGGSRTLLKTGAGWAFEPESVASLVETMREIVRDRNEMRSRGVIARTYVQRHYSWAHSAERLEAIMATRLGVVA